MPNIHSVLQNFEKTISANEEAGVSSKMFLSNIAKKQPTGTAGIAMKPATSGLRKPHPRGRPVHPPNKKLPTKAPAEKNIFPCDVTVTTATTCTSAFSGSEFDVWAEDDDPFNDRDPGGASMNDDNGDDHSEDQSHCSASESSFVSFASQGSKNLRLHPVPSQSLGGGSSHHRRRKPPSSIGAMMKRDSPHRAVRSIPNYHSGEEEDEEEDDDGDDGFACDDGLFAVSFPKEDDMSVYSATRSTVSMTGGGGGVGGNGGGGRSARTRGGGEASTRGRRTTAAGGGGAAIPSGSNSSRREGMSKARSSRRMELGGSRGDEGSSRMARAGGCGEASTRSRRTTGSGGGDAAPAIPSRSTSIRQEGMVKAKSVGRLEAGGSAHKSKAIPSGSLSNRREAIRSRSITRRGPTSATTPTSSGKKAAGDRPHRLVGDGCSSPPQRPRMPVDGSSPTSRKSTSSASSRTSPLSSSSSSGEQQQPRRLRPRKPVTAEKGGAAEKKRPSRPTRQ